MGLHLTLELGRQLFSVFQIISKYMLCQCSMCFEGGGICDYRLLKCEAVEAFISIRGLKIGMKWFG